MTRQHGFRLPKHGTTVAKHTSKLKKHATAPLHTEAKKTSKLKKHATASAQPVPKRRKLKRHDAAPPPPPLHPMTHEEHQALKDVMDADRPPVPKRALDRLTKTKMPPKFKSATVVDHNIDQPTGDYLTPADEIEHGKELAALQGRDKVKKVVNAHKAISQMKKRCQTATKEKRRENVFTTTLCPLCHPPA